MQVVTSDHGTMRARSGLQPNTSGSWRADAWAWVLVGCGVGAALAAVMPIGAVQPTDMPVLFLALAALCACAWMLLHRLRDEAHTTSLPWRVLHPLALFLAGGAVSTAFSDQRWTALLGAPGSSLGLLQLLALAAVVVGAAYMGGRLRNALVLAAPWMLLLQSVAVAFRMLAGRNGIGTLSNSSFMAQVIVVLLPLALVPALGRDPRLSSAGVAGRLAASVAAVVALAASGSRAGVVLALGGTAVCWALTRGWQPPLPLGRTRLAAVSVGAVALAVVPVVAVLAVARGRVPRGLLAVRPEMWDAALRVWRDAPVLGAGPDAYRVASAPFAGVALAANEAAVNLGFGALAADPHNVVMLLLANGGIVAFVAAAWLLAEVLRNWAAQRAAGRLDAAAALGATLYVLTGLLTPLPLQTALLGAIVLGASLAPERAPAAPTVPRTALRTAAWGPWVLSALAALVVLAHVTTRIAVGPIEEGNVTPGRAARTQAAADLWRADPFLHFWAGRMWMFVADESPDGLRLAIADSAKAAEMEPANPFYVRDKALAMKLYSEDVTATSDAYRAALELFPNWFEATFEFGDYLLEHGRAEEAEVYALRAVELGPGIGEAHGFAAAVYDALGEPAKAEGYRRRATELLAEKGTLQQMR
ncbi:MAG: hypothetical protein C0418_04170 [Coriobacteriaceae bacterium]|nr:hypothetical protein [Coriobacteriaceae bacterium]